jgi:diguanylate cyclase (GGDEF)-like protein/PAS domain S-box-containing protein
MQTRLWNPALPAEMHPVEGGGQDASLNGHAGTSKGATADPDRLNLTENSNSRQQQEILDALPVLVFLERAGKVVYANTEARNLLGHTEGDWVPRPVEEVLWGLFPGTAEPLTQLIGTRKGSPFHATVPARSGRLLPVEGTYSLLNAELRESVIVAHSSGRERAPKSRLMEDVLASIPEAVVIEHGGHVLYSNPAFTEMFGYTGEEASGASLTELIVPETRRHEVAMFEKQVDTAGRLATETVRANKSGELLDVSLVAGPLRVDGGKVGYVLSFRDIGERKEREKKVSHDALYDVLTGLPNRALFMDRVEFALLRRSRRTDQSCGVLLMDLDRFKEIRDALGEAAAEALLLAVAERLRAALRPQDSASRVGADEFAILVENILEPGDLEIVASRVLHEIERPYEIFGNIVKASASMGVAMAGAEHNAAGKLMQDADFALARARQEGGGGFEIFDKNLEPPAKMRREPERELRRVMEKRQFEVWYQPIYWLESGKLEGFESLLRLRRSDGSVESFREMLSVAEATGLSVSLGRETLHTACRQLRVWNEGRQHDGLTLTVNATHRQFYHPELIEQITKALAAHPVDPSKLIFEVAETTLNENMDAALGILERIAALNVRLAVDNFGESLAPINYLVRLPIEMVKMTPSFTAAAVVDGPSRAVAESIIGLGHALGVQVVAQGIETNEQLEALCRMGCEFGQGHLLSYALEAARATRLAGRGYWAIAEGA